MILAAAAIVASVNPDPYGIFNQARAVWEQARYPSYMRYNVVVRVDENGTPRISHYHLLYDAVNDYVSFDAVSEEERDHPHVAPPGVNFGINIFGGFLPVSKPEEPVDYLGVPELAPNYSFGIAKYVPGRPHDSKDLVQEIRREYHDPAPAATAPPPSSDLKVIGNVEAMRRDYVMTYDGIEPVNGHDDYHVSLRATHDPKRFRLRELWVNDKSFMTDKLVSDGNFAEGPGQSVRWNVTFAQVDGAPVIVSESTDATLRLHRRGYSNISIAFAQMTPLQSLPLETNFSRTTAPLLTEPQ
ncbi:MAG: hypothetical protein ACXVAW_07310 [Vulcanimicrobiaceae bacterium]